MLTIFFLDQFTEMDLVVNTVSMFIAGAEPVSSILAFFQQELAMNKHV